MPGGRGVEGTMQPRAPSIALPEGQNWGGDIQTRIRTSDASLKPTDGVGLNFGIAVLLA